MPSHGIAPESRLSSEEVYKPFTWFISECNLDRSDFNLLIKAYKIEKEKDKYYPVTTVIRALDDHRRIRGDKRLKVLNELDEEKKREEIRKLRIYNDNKSGISIKRSYAKERVRITFQHVVSKIKYAIKNVSPRLIGMESARIIEEVITKSWNGAITLLEEESKCLDWEDDGLRNESRDFSLDSSSSFEKDSLGEKADEIQPRIPSFEDLDNERINNLGLGER